MNPRALEKAESLSRFVRASGSALQEFALALTLDEALELVEYYAAHYAGVEEFELDLEIARRTKNPWPILDNFQCSGLAIAPATEILN